MEFVRKAITLSHTFIILIVVGIAFTCHNEWQEVEALEVDNRRIDEFRKEVNRIHIQLIEFSLLGETVLDWDETDLENYHAQRITLDRTLYLFNKIHAKNTVDKSVTKSYSYPQYSQPKTNKWLIHKLFTSYYVQLLIIFELTFLLYHLLCVLSSRLYLGFLIFFHKHELQ